MKIKNKIITTPHGEISAPFFMPDATRGFIKLSSADELAKVGVKAMVVNTFHLHLQPGMAVIKKAKGIHNFMGWNGPLLSDSGGYQIFSLIHKNPKMGKIDDEKVVFKSPLNGSINEITPEKSIQIQFDLGVDMIVCLDDCPPNDFDENAINKSVERTIMWARRCSLEYDKQIKKRKISSDKKPLLFSVIQGGTSLELRKKCVEGLNGIREWDGYGFGARHVGAEGEFLSEVLEYTVNLIPEKSLRFALGVGLPEDIVRCRAMGWDMFDCVIPTREGRHGKLFFRRKGPKYSSEILANMGKISNFYTTINISNSKFINDFSPINPDSKLPELKNYTKAYLHHLFRLNEPLGQRLASLNNLEFYNELMDVL